MFPVVESGGRYFAQPTFPEPVEAGLMVEHPGRFSVRYRTGIFGENSDQAATEGHFVHVNVHRTSHKPVPISNAVRAILKPLQGADRYSERQTVQAHGGG